MDRDDQIVCFVCRTVCSEMTRLSVLCAGQYGQSCPDCWFCVLDLMDRDD